MHQRAFGPVLGLDDPRIKEATPQPMTSHVEKTAQSDLFLQYPAAGLAPPPGAQCLGWLALGIGLRVQLRASPARATHQAQLHRLHPLGCSTIKATHFLSRNHLLLYVDPRQQKNITSACEGSVMSSTLNHNGRGLGQVARLSLSTRLPSAQTQGPKDV